MGISWSQLLERNDQNIINDGQLQVHIGTVGCLGTVHVLPNPVIGVCRHALVEVGGRERHDDSAHSGQVIDTQVTIRNIFFSRQGLPALAKPRC
jgi:hypothetical protein